MELQETRSMDFASSEREASLILLVFFNRWRLTLVR